MNFIFDSSSLMYLGKIKILEKIKFISGKNYIPKKVYEEVITKGFERKEPEIGYIENLIKNNIFTIEQGGIILKDFPLLSEADKEVLSVAKETSSTAIIDETYAKKIARSISLSVHGSIYIIIKLLEKKLITKIEAKNKIDQIIKLGFYRQENILKL